MKPEHMKVMGINDSVILTRINWERVRRDGEDHDITSYEVRDRDGPLLFKIDYLKSVRVQPPHTTTEFYIKTGPDDRHIRMGWLR